jgi:DNA helicase-2/ATP-dependent DNA helicase PcrA
VRSHTYLSLPELVTHAERALGLDVEVDVAAGLAAATSEGVGDLGRAHLDAFRDVATDFSRSADAPTLGAFLGWLAAAMAQSGGLDRPLRDVDPHAVQVITVHGAKGLEWDVVAVPGLVNGTFPSKTPTANGDWTDNAWLWRLGALPYPLRGDAADLPHLAFEDADDAKELKDEISAFQLRCGEHQLAEERRLAYVAFTRARRELHLSGSWWRSGSTPREPSVLLTDLVDAGLVIVDSWADEPSDGDANPLAGQTRSATWPSSGTRSDAIGAIRAAAARVDEALASEESVLASSRGPSATGDRDRMGGADLTEGADVADLAALARLLLAERADHDGARAEVAFPAHVSASGLVALATDRDAFALARRRPVPRQPSAHARRGTRFHAWVERYYGSSALLDIDDIPGPGDDGAIDDERLEELKETFLRSPWAAREPLAIEADVETPVGGVVVRSRIDAVFPERFAGPEGGEVPGALVVDWKTGRAPSDEASARARAVQLAVYRLAWSRWSGLPLERVSAAFYYVADDEVSSPVDLLGEVELEELVRGG